MEHDEAIKCYKAIEIKPDDAPSWNNKGAALKKLGRNEDAIKAYDKALEIKPDDALSWNNKGSDIGELGKYEAIQCIDKALEIDPNFTLAQNNKDIINKKIQKEKRMVQVEFTKKLYSQL